MPDGTVLTLVQYRAKLGADGNPEKDANGRFIKGDLVAYTVMEKRKGWGTEYPDDIRNGEWEYQAFTAAKQPNPNAKLVACFECHKPLPSGEGLRVHVRQDGGEVAPRERPAGPSRIMAPVSARFAAASAALLELPELEIAPGR